MHLLQRRETIYDAIIVGSGAAGGIAANLLVNKGLEALLLDIGPKWDPTSSGINTNLDSSTFGVSLRQGAPGLSNSMRGSLSPSMDAPSTAVGLDGEEIETGCELKGLALRRTYG